MANSIGPIYVDDVSKLQLPPPSDQTMFSVSTKAMGSLPTKKNPIRFAVIYRSGYTSNAWGVKVNSKGDAYIYCRDHMAGQEISLHASGKQHISIDPNSHSTVTLAEKKYMNQWREPDEGVATFRLVFPSWGTLLSEEQREKYKSRWKNTDVLIEGHHEFLTIVSFFIVSRSAKMHKSGTFPSFQLGELPLRSGKKLATTVEWKPENGLKDKIESALQRIGRSEERVQDHLKNLFRFALLAIGGSPILSIWSSFP